MNTSTITSPIDGLKLSVAVIEPETPATGVIQFVHGMCEHKERYFAVMEWFAAKGYVCVIHDHRGHGASVLSMKDLGYMYEGGWKAMVEDIKAVGDWARNRYPGLPFTLFGHSMGSLAVRSYVKRYDDTVDALFVCGCPSDNPAKGIGKALALITGKTMGWHYRPQLLHKLSFGEYNKPFKDEKDASGKPYRSAWLCTDTKVLDEYDNNPLCQFVFTANGFYNLLGMMQDCYSPKGWKMANPSLPVHFISGADDPCRISDGSFNKAVGLMRNVGYCNVSSKLYPGMRHEILGEKDKLSVWNDILELL